MDQPAVIHHTFQLEREYPVPVERVFAAFADPAKKQRWYGERSTKSALEEFTLDFRIGGIERFQYRFQEGTRFPGSVLLNDGTYQDIVDDERIVLASTMSLQGKRISASLLTFQFIPRGGRTQLVFTHQAAFFEGSDGPQMREQGWVALLDGLAESLT